MKTPRKLSTVVNIYKITNTGNIMSFMETKTHYLAGCFWVLKSVVKQTGNINPINLTNGQYPRTDKLAENTLKNIRTEKHISFTGEMYKEKYGIITGGKYCFHGEVVKYFTKTIGCRFVFITSKGDPIIKMLFMKDGKPVGMVMPRKVNK